MKPYAAGTPETSVNSSALKDGGSVFLRNFDKLFRYEDVCNTCPPETSLNSSALKDGGRMFRRNFLFLFVDVRSAYPRNVGKLLCSERWRQHSPPTLR
jgi:hypothetical protein